MTAAAAIRAREEAKRPKPAPKPAPKPKQRVIVDDLAESSREQTTSEVES